MKKMKMSFDDKFARSFRKLDEYSRPDCPKSDINLYADFVELLVLFSKGDGISYGDLQDRFYGEHEEYDEEVNADYRDASQRNDENESFINNIFSLIDERGAQYGEEYPFRLTDGRSLVLKSVKNDLSQPQMLYLFLLVSSSLNIFKDFNSEITTDFETVSYEVVKRLIPNAITKRFGKKSDYRGTAKEKIRNLSKDIGWKLIDCNFSCIDDGNVQERGLDIVSWIPFEDNCHNRIVFFCQCACGKGYEYKQHDDRRAAGYFERYLLKPLYTLFIPYSLINPKSGYFYHSDCFEDEYLIFERYRIISFARRELGFLAELSSIPIIDRCLQSYYA